MTTTATVDLPRKLVGLFKAPRGAHQYRAMHGGRGSGKSFGAAKMAAIWGMIEPLRILCTREFQASIKESFHAELKAAIASEPWLEAHYDVGVDYLRGANGTEFIFRGLRHNVGSIKSLAKIDLTICEEAEDIPEPSWLALEATVFRQPKSELWAIWNPRLDGSPVDKRFRKSPPDTAQVVELNWQDNPFFPEGLNTLRTREQSRLDPATYAHVWEGAYLENSDAQIFAGKTAVEPFEPKDNWQGPYFGGDFGFSQDPTAAVEVWIAGDELFIRREAFKTGLELDDTAAFVAGKIPRFELEVSRWDNARPESISYLKRHGLPRAQAVDKWKGSVEDGITFLRSFRRIVIHPSCANMQREARLYSYKKDRITDDITTTIVDAHNHGWDACIAEGETIHTARGHIPVEQVSVGDFVMTRRGYKRVYAAGLTGTDRRVVRVITTRGSVICTPDHRVWTNQGWTRADALRYGVWVAEEPNTCGKQRLGTARSGIAGLTQTIEATGNILSAQLQVALCIFTGLFGRQSEGRYQTAITSTTGTATAGITGLKTLSACHQKIMLTSIPCVGIALKDIASTLTKLGRLQPSGTDRQKAARFIGKSQSNLGRLLFQRKRSATVAGGNSLLGRAAKATDFVLTRVSRLGGALRDWMMKSGFVLSAKAHSGSTNIARRNHALGRVLRVEELRQSANVYDISVEECPEFFAGGVLVHNCRYAVGPMIRQQRKAQTKTGHVVGLW